MAILGYIALLALMFTNMSSVVLLFIPAFFIFSANGILSVLTTVFLENTVDYGELLNKRRDESVIFSMQTFVVKLASGVAALVASVCLSVFNLSKDTNGEAMKASMESVIGLRATMTLLPGVELVIAFIYFKKKFILTESKVKEIEEEIKKQRNEA